MNAIYFIDKAPEAALPLPALTFADDLPQQSSEDPAVPVIDNDLPTSFHTRLHGRP
jgi:hypothetical protein